MVTCPNMLPSKNGISSELSPSEIILGYPNLDYNKFKITLGAYAEVYIGTINRTKKRALVVIALRPENR